MRTNTKPRTTAPKTHEGATAKRITPELELRRSILSCMLFEDTFYENSISIVDRIDDLASRVAPEKVAELAIEARTAGNLRHAPLRLLLALVKRGYIKTHEVIAEVVQRPDEAPELLNQYMNGDSNKPLDNQLKRGLALAFNKWDKYQIAKYQGHDRKVTLRDTMFLVHPDPTKNVSKDRELMPDVYKQLADNSLPAPDSTWEKISSSQKFDSDKEKWEYIIDTWVVEGKVRNHLAIIRNLRNIINAGIDKKHTDKLKKAFNHPSWSNTGILPFQFIVAAKYAPSMESELETAMF